MTMARTPVSIIFTGLIRDKAMFLRSLDAFRGVEEVHEIILSTWDKEARDCLEFLSKIERQFDLTVSAVPEPQSWSGNMLSQMVALQMGLRRVPEGNRVLKTRTDVFVEPDALGHILAQDPGLDFPKNFARGIHNYVTTPNPRILEKLSSSNRGGGS